VHFIYVDVTDIMWFFLCFWSTFFNAVIIIQHFLY